MSSEDQTEELSGGQMSFLEHVDELRRRLVNSVIIIMIAFAVCWAFSDRIYDFLSVPVRQAISEAERREVAVEGPMPAVLAIVTRCVDATESVT